MAASFDRQASSTCSILAVVGSGMGEDIGATPAREPARPAGTLNRLVSAAASGIFRKIPQRRHIRCTRADEHWSGEECSHPGLTAAFPADPRAVSACSAAKIHAVAAAQV